MAKVSSITDIYPGPSSSAVGVDHDYDYVLVWLNPVLNFSLGSNQQNIVWQGYNYNSTDPYYHLGMDVVDIPVFCLENPYSTLNACSGPSVLPRLQRAWDASGLGGLTPADYAEILASDPFIANPSLNPDVTVNNVLRYDPEPQDTPINYPPAVPGGQPFTTQGSWGTTVTTTEGQGASDTKSLTVSTKSTADEASFLGSFGASLQVSNTLTWVNKWGIVNSNANTNTIGYSIKGPAYADNYQGPSAFTVYKDNVYGSLMFYAEGFAPFKPNSITLIPSSISFPATKAGTVSASIPVTIQNSSATGTLPMTISTPPMNFSDSSLSLTANTCTTPLQPGQSCSIAIAFTPTATDTANGPATIVATGYASGTTGLSGSNVNGVYVQQSLPIQGAAIPAFAVGAISVAGTEGVATVGATAGSGIITISGTEGSHLVCTSAMQAAVSPNMAPPIPPTPTCHTVYDTGTISVQIDGFNASASYASGATDASVAQALATALSGSGSPVTASASGSSIALKSLATGTASNYPIVFTNGTDFSGAESGGSLSGGSNGTPVYDAGSISVTIGTATTPVYTWGQNSTAGSIAAGLTNLINATSSLGVTAALINSGLVEDTGGTAIQLQAANSYATTPTVTVNATDTMSANFPTPSFTFTPTGLACANIQTGGGGSGPNPKFIFRNCQ